MQGISTSAVKGRKEQKKKSFHWSSENYYFLFVSVDEFHLLCMWVLRSKLTYNDYFVCILGSFWDIVSHLDGHSWSSKIVLKMIFLLFLLFNYDFLTFGFI
jgi:hypothetical protein